MSRRHTSEDNKDEKALDRLIRSTFIDAGFKSISCRNKEIEVEGVRTEFDHFYCYGNVWILIEQTTGNSRGNNHFPDKLRKFSILLQNKQKLQGVLRSKLNLEIDLSEFSDTVVFRILYVSLHAQDLKLHSIEHQLGIRLLRIEHLRYFRSLSKTVKLSCKYEILKYLDISDHQVTGIRAHKHLDLEGFQLQSTRSLPQGISIVSFYCAPDILLKRGYVLRRDSWQDGDALYQRMIDGKKIMQMRKFLAEKRGVYYNNIIVSLPRGTRFEYSSTAGNNGRGSGQVIIPDGVQDICIIDGQHRVMCYHEGVDTHERDISALRNKHDLLVTGIIYPESWSADDRIKHEAGLFYEINTAQKRLAAAVRQSIQTVLKPYSAVAISKAITNRLALDHPFSGVIKSHHFGTGKVSPSSIIDYGLKYVVDIEGPNRHESLYKIWRSENGDIDISSDEKSRLSDYQEFCCNHLKLYFKGFVADRKEVWISDRSRSMAQSTVAINGLIHCFREIVSSGKLQDYEGYRQCFSRLTIDFSPKEFRWGSSGWKRLGGTIFLQCFG